MGSKSSSATSTTEVVNTTNKNISGLESEAQAFADISGGLTLNNLDGGAIADAFDFAGDLGSNAFGFGRDSLDFAGGGLDSILDFGGDIIEGQQAQLTDTLASINAANATSANLTDVTQADTIKTVVKYVAVAGVVLGGIMLFKKVRK